MVVRTKFGRWMTAALLASTLTGCKNGFEIPIWNPFARSTASLQRDGDGYVQPNAPEVTAPTPAPARAEEFGWNQPFKKIGNTISAPFRKSDTADAQRPESEATSLVAHNNPEPKLYIDLAKNQERVGHFDSAIEMYQKALAIEEDNVAALLGAARLYDRLEKFEEAVILYERAIEVQPDNAAALNDLGLCYARNKNLTESINYLQRAVTLEPNKVLYRNNLATVLVSTDRAQEAYRTLVPAHGEAIAHYNVGFLLTKHGRSDEALEQFRAAVKADPALRQAQQWVVALEGETPTAATPASGAARPAVTTQERRPLSEPVATPYVPQSDQPRPAMTPVSRPTIVDEPAGQQSTARQPESSSQAVPTYREPAVTPSPTLPTTAAPAATTEDAGPKLIGNEQARRAAAANRPQQVAQQPAATTPNPAATQPATQPQTAAQSATPTTVAVRPQAILPPLPESPASGLPAATSSPPTSTTPHTANGARYPASRY